MGICDTKPKASFRCTYDVKDYDEVRILHYRSEVYNNLINEEIKQKIKILNDNQKQKLIFKKRFNKIGYNTIDFIIEGQLTNMSFMFNLCSSLKKVEFISIDTSIVTNMRAMFQECNELEYLDLTNFNTSNVTDMGWMFFDCYKLKEIKRN